MLFGSRGKSRLGGGNGRRAKRLQTNMLNCHLGSVVDISSTGVRVAGEGKIPVKRGQMVQLKLESAQQRLPVTAQVVWVKRRFKKYTIGLRFLETSRSVTAAVESLARFGFIDFDAARRKQGGVPLQARVHLPDYYGLLGLSLGATDSQIKQAYRSMARKYHPDVCQDPEGPEKFTRITQAYEVLSDQRSRRSYDDRLRTAMAG
jgi:hypothetical protein